MQGDGIDTQEDHHRRFHFEFGHFRRDLLADHAGAGWLYAHTRQHTGPNVYSRAHQYANPPNAYSRAHQYADPYTHAHTATANAPSCTPVAKTAEGYAGPHGNH